MFRTLEIYSEVSIRRTKRFKCKCGRRTTRTKKFWQTINPYNKYKGFIKTIIQILKEIMVEGAKWIKARELCTHYVPKSKEGIYG